MPKPKMSKERQGEIALLAVQKMLAKNGLKGGDQFRRDVGNEAKELGIDAKELMEFYIIQLPMVVGTITGASHVGLIINETKYE